MMIIISTTQSNKVIMTLGEKSSLTQSYYTFRIIDQNSLNRYIFSPDNNSTSPYYDAFTISVGTNSSFTSSVVLDLVGSEYHYEVYEMGTQYDLNINNSIGLVETGLINVYGTYSFDIITYTASDDNTIVVYNKI